MSICVVCCGQENVNKIMPDFKQNQGINLKLTRGRGGLTRHLHSEAPTADR